VDLDLGAIGKGFALDRMNLLLREWSVQDFLIHSGHSSVSVGRDRGDWQVSLTNPENNEILAIIALKTGALSASGVKKGAHIVDPRTGNPVKPGRCVWVHTESAARADALSTAFMVMEPGEIEKICGSYPGLSACILEDGRCTDLGLLS
jgi:thiamine biosynthesis lipoprotein